MLIKQSTLLFICLIHTTSNTFNWKAGVSIGLPLALYTSWQLASPDINQIILHDAQENILYINPEFSDYVQLEAQKILGGKRPFELIAQKVSTSLSKVSSHRTHTTDFIMLSPEIVQEINESNNIQEVITKYIGIIRVELSNLHYHAAQKSLLTLTIVETLINLLIYGPYFFEHDSYQASPEPVIKIAGMAASIAAWAIIFRHYYNITDELAIAHAKNPQELLQNSLIFKDFQKQISFLFQKNFGPRADKFEAAARDFSQNDYA